MSFGQEEGLVLVTVVNGVFHKGMSVVGLQKINITVSERAMEAEWLNLSINAQGQRLKSGRIHSEDWSFPIFKVVRLDRNNNLGILVALLVLND